MMKEKNILIIGAGPGGLSAGWQIAKNRLGKVTILEKQDYSGGVCRTIKWDDYRADLGPHKIFSLLPGVMEETLGLFNSDEIIKHTKKNRLFLLGNYLKYPISIVDMLKTIGPLTAIAMGFSLVFTKLINLFKPKREDNYEDYIVNRFGRKLYELVFKPLALKVWGEPKTLSVDIAKTRIPASNAIDVLLRAIGVKKEKVTTNASFFYYPEKGFGQIPLKMHKQIEQMGGCIKTNAKDIKLEVNDNKIVRVSYSVQGILQEIIPDVVISAFPLKELLHSLSGHDYGEVMRLADSLPLRHTILIYLCFDTPKMLDDHWIFISDKDIIFSRIYEPKVLSSQMAPDDKTVICCDLTASGNESAWKMSDSELSDQCREGLEKMGLINRGDVVSSYKVVRIENFYPRYEVGYREKLEKIISEINKISNIICTGRLGLYNYNNFDHCMHMGISIAKGLKEGLSPSDVCSKIFNDCLEYRIVD